MESRLVQSETRSPSTAYAVGVLAAVAAMLIRVPLQPALEGKVPYITFFLATAASASFGGLGPGLVTTFVGGLLAAVYVVPPTGSLVFADPYDYLGLVIFLSVSSFISFTCGRLLEARHHERALRQIFQQTLVSIGDAVISTDTDQRVRFMNRVAEEMTGWREQNAKGKLIHEVFHIVKEGSDTAAEIPIEKVIKTGRIVGLANHTELITTDGRRVPIDDSASPIKNEGGELVGAVLVFRDITQRRRAELALEAAEKHSRTILESITEAFVLLDSEWRVKAVNPAAERLINAPASKLLGKHYREVYPGTLGTSLGASFEKAAADGVPVHFETHYAPWSRWFEIHAYPSAEGLAVYTRDITERKQNESDLLRLNEDLTQFTFAATHDVREPLRAIRAYAQLLQRKPADALEKGDRDRFVAHIIGGAQRIERLVEGLLQFSRIGNGAQAKFRSVDSGAALKEAMELLRLSIKEAEASISYGGLPRVFADETHLIQLFQNLIANAIKYRTPEIPPVIRVFSATHGSDHTFTVEDNGIGIPPEFHSYIFQPFKRLHGPEVTGAGIGLATCKRIVERYGGRIWVESEGGGNGSKFCFTLPIAEEDDLAGA